MQQLLNANVFSGQEIRVTEGNFSKKVPFLTSHDNILTELILFDFVDLIRIRSFAFYYYSSFSKALSHWNCVTLQGLREKKHKFLSTILDLLAE